MKQILDENHLVLIEASVVERLRRAGKVELHPRLVHANWIYDDVGRHELAKVFGSYIDIARRASLPLILCTPTWRANRERVHESGVNREVNVDAARFMRALCAGRGAKRGEILIGGLIGCKNDCYRPEEGLSATEAVRFHSWQVDQLAGAGVDFLIVETLPNVQEGAGILKAMAATDLPYIISFVINRAGRVLDGTPLWDAVKLLDEVDGNPPVGYMANCSHPSFLNAARQPAELFTRFIGYQANASSLDQVELDGRAEIDVDDVSTWGDQMLTLNREYGVKILGGCCGTGVEHLEYLVENQRRKS